MNKDKVEQGSQAGLAAKRKQLAALLAKKKKQQAKKTIPALATVPDRGDKAVTSFAQKRLWFIDQLDGDSTHYNICVSVRISGQFDVDRANEAFSTLLERHEPLRTVYRKNSDDAEGAEQVILPSRPFVVNQRRVTEESLPAALQAVQNHVFMLRNDLMLRVDWLALSDNEGELVICMHHIAADGWSMQVLISEFLALYQQQPVADITVRYSDYASWQREHFTEQNLDSSLNWWQKTLQDLPPVHSLPLDFPRPARQTFNGENLRYVIDADLASSLKALAAKHNVTLFMLLHSVFSVALARFSNVWDIVVGTPVAGRDDKALEGLIGCFVNTLILRLKFTPDMTFAALLEQARQVNLDAQQHQQVPLDMLVERINPARNNAVTPLFQVLFSMDPVVDYDHQNAGFTLGEFKPVNEPAKFDLSLNISEQGDKLTISLNYNSDLFAANSANRMLSHFSTLLASVADNEHQAVSALALLNDTDQTLLVETLNTQAISADIQTDINTRCIHELIEDQVNKTPNATAVIASASGVSLTYRQLNDKANQLAGFLRERLAEQLAAMQPGDEPPLVGISTQRSEIIPVAMLAILKAGAAWVSLDPNYPMSRLRHMLENSQAKLVLTESVVKDKLDVQDDVALLALDSDEITEQLATFPTTNPEKLSHQTPESLAYVIYTSGSTGKPKGVMILHKGVVALTRWTQEHYSADELAVVLASTSINFDLSTYELMVPLASGGTSVVVKNILSVLEGLPVDITLINTVPSGIQALLNEGKIPASVKAINLAGEKLTKGLVKGLHQYGRDHNTELARVVNLYGPSEDTTYSTWFSMPVEPPLSTEPFIGKPLYNTQAYILDDQLNLVPVGVYGELYLAGDGLSRGYLNQPELTAERFIENPFQRDELNNPLMYKTGDVVRWLDNGEIEYQGRADHQVKVRGFRIELEEIDSQLAAAEGVESCAVIVFTPEDGNSNDARLVAYIKPDAPKNDGQKQQAIIEFKAHLGRQLPEYMVPEVYVFLEDMPLTPNGKINRKALPEPGEQDVQKAEYVAPGTATEKALCVLWQSLLRMEKVSIHDNFFHLGGHSLLAERMASQVRQQFKKELPLRVLFERATVADVARYLDSDAGQSSSHATTLNAVTEQGVAPLSAAQQRLWFVDKLATSAAAKQQYNMSQAFFSEGELDITAVKRAVQTILERHTVLRSVIRANDDANSGVTQQVQSQFDVPVIVDDLQTASEQQINAAIRIAADYHFDLTRDVLLRLSVLKTAPAQQVLVFTMHHIASDGWSAQLLFKEFCALYNGYRTGEQHVVLPALPVQYSDYAIWQQQQINAIQTDQDSPLSWWRDQLSDAPSVHSLTTDYTRPEQQRFDGGVVLSSFDEALTSRIQQACRDWNVTPFILLQSAFAAFINRLSGWQEKGDILMGAPVAGRQHNAVENLIGFFVNTVVLRSQIDSTISFHDFLTQNRTTVLDAFNQQQVPFDLVVEAVNPARSLSYSPLFQIMFDYQAAQPGNMLLDDIALTVVAPEHTSAKFDLTLTISEPFSKDADSAATLQCEWEFATSLFRQRTIEAMAQRFEHWLSAVLAQAHQPMAELSLLNDREQQMQQRRLSGIKRPSDTVTAIWQQALNASLQQNPEAVAVNCGDQTLTFAQLAEQAEQLAALIQQQGVTSGQRVAICMNRGIDAVTAVLAVLKAGAAFVPVDPAYPEERISFMLQDSAVALVLADAMTSRQHSALFAEYAVINTSTVVLSDENTFNAPTLSADDTAYVIYTSGSTGQPKGVMISHGNWAAYQQAIIKDYGLTAYQPGSQHILQFSSIAFDIFIEELSMSILSGNRLVIPEDTSLMDSNRFWQLVHEQQITIASLPTAWWHQLAADDALATQALNTSLHTLITGGEAMSAQQVTHWQQALGQHIRLFNTYGPTETTVIATLFDCRDYQPAQHDALPIGEAMSGAVALVVDEQAQPVADGVIGELIIAGPGVGQGYLNQPALSDEKFIALHAGDVSVRAYRTGDLVKRLTDGQLSFEGRVDDQVKIRGFRIEPGEIASCLMQSATVAEAFVMAVTIEGQADKQLIAWACPVSGEQLDIDAELQALRDQLPGYMVPSALIALETLPLTTNGKVDKRQLPMPEAQAQQTASHTKPRTALESRLLATWQQVLGLENAGIDDNFFASGGHSLLAIQLVSQLRNDLQLEVPVKAIFEQPTIATLANWLNEQGLATLSGEQVIPAIEPAKRDSNRLPLSFAQQRLWFIDELEGASPQYNMPGAFTLTGELDVNRFKAAMATVIDRHEILRTTYHSESGTGYQLIHQTVELPVTEHDFSDLSRAEQQISIAALLKEDGATAFNLQTDVMLRVQLVRTATNAHTVIFNMHHIASDGWSMGVLVKEFAACYDAENKLPGLSIQYGDFASWQRNWLQGDIVAEQLSWWRSRLSGIPELHGLATDFPRPANQQYQGAIFHRSIDADLLQRLSELANSQDMTLFMLLQSSFALLLSRFSRETDIVMGTPVAGRPHQQLEQLIGCFVNTVVLRADLADNPTLADYFTANKQGIIDAFNHQDLPFEQLVEALSPGRNSAHSPIFQIMFVMQNPDEQSLELPGLTLEAIAPSQPLTKFDLTLTLSHETNEQGETTLNAQWEYCADLFAADSMQQLAHSYEQLLLAVLDAADNAELASRHVQQLALQSDEEKTTQIDRWQQAFLKQHDSQATLAFDRLELAIEQFAAQQPELTAVRQHTLGSEQTISLNWQQLDEQANQLAHLLIEQGVKSGDRVAIGLNRSNRVVVSMLAVLKAGAVYVPVDPESPATRLAHILSDSQATCVLTTSDIADRFAAETTGADVSCVLLDVIETSGYPGTTPVVDGLTRQDPAYIIYTSGTTGLPKGVVQTHHNVIRLLQTAQTTEFYGQFGGFGTSDVWTLFHSTAFDFSVWEIWGALCFGGRLEIPDNQFVKDTPAFVKLCEKTGVTVLNQTPGAFRAFSQVAIADDVNPDSLRFVIFGGEALQIDSLMPWWNQFGDSLAFINMYGITETTVHVTFKHIDMATFNQQGGASVIGCPLGDQIIYLVDQELSPVPQGAIGEILVGGAGLSAGYLNQPELTSQKFIPNPWLTLEGHDRLYRSGDLARFTAEGELVYIGRTDDQVKVRGYRIEQGEVVSQLMQLPYIKEAITQVTPDAQGNLNLVAYAITGEQTDVETIQQQWRDDLSGRLPAYMIPTSLEVLDHWPLTVNGKIDRAALPAPAFTQQVAYVAPETLVEQKLAEIWAELLDTDAATIGRHADFFALGGHSLLMIQYRAALQQQGVDVTVADLFKNSRLSAAAQLIQQAQPLAFLTSLKASATSAVISAPQTRLPEDVALLSPAAFPLVELERSQLSQIVELTNGGIENLQDIYPLSPLQEGMLFHALQQQDDTDPYLVKTAFRCDTDAAWQLLHDGLQFVMNRHDSLRAAIVTDEQIAGLQQPLQIICKHITPVVEHAELPALADFADSADWLAAVQLPAQAGWSLSRAPLLRVLVGQQGNERLVVLFHHHILEDNYSLRVINDDLQAFIQQARHEEHPGAVNSDELAALLPASGQYRDFIWQGMQTELADAQQFFRHQLADIDETCAPFGVHQVGEASLQQTETVFDANTLAALQQIASKHQVSLTALLHLAWSLVVARTAGTEQPVFGTVLSGRMQAIAGIDRMVGLCINTLPFSWRYQAMSLNDNLKAAHQYLVELAAFEQIPLSVAQSCSQVMTGNDSQGLFSSVLNCRLQQTNETATIDLMSQAGINSLGMEEHTNYPLTASFDFVDDGLKLTVEAVPAIGSALIAEYVSAAFEHLITANNSASDVQTDTVLALPMLLTAAQQDLLIHELNNTARDYDVDAVLHQLIAQQAEVQPDAVAVICNDEQLTFAQLDHQANQIAQLLLDKGIQSGDLVGMCFRREIAVMPVILGILKTGAGYVPLSPDYPQERLSYMAQDSGISTVIAGDDQADKFAELSRLSVAEAANYPAQSPEISVASSALAYVVYTSGSTGLPKGVAVSHRNVTSLCLNSPFLDLDRTTGMFGLSNVSFDGSVFDLFTSLVNGKPVLMLTEAQLTDTSNWDALCRAHGINTVFMTTALFNVLVTEQNPVLAQLEQLMFGGEQANTVSIQRWIDVYGETDNKLIHVYGPTETTVFASYGPLDSQNVNKAPIGQPLANKSLFVLDAHQVLVPPGTTGELYIGGDGVAQQYLNRAELTAERFIPNPFSDCTGERLYRTGDLVRWEQDNAGRWGLVFVGRVDNQVKIRGFRIELEEVESQLASCQNVSESAVIVARTGEGEQQFDTLVGFIVGEGISDVATVKAELIEQMPAWMVPSLLIKLDNMPLTANGKVNKQALQAIAVEQAITANIDADRFTAPVSDIEVKLTELLAGLLQRESAQISASTSFFEMGGNSLLVMRLVSAIKATFSAAIAVQDIFELQTVSAIAAFIQQQGEGSATELTIPVVNRDQELPLSFAQQRLWFIYQLEGSSAQYNMPAAFRLKGDFDLTAFRQTMNEIVERHEVLRTNYVTVDGQSKQVIRHQVKVPVHDLDLTGLSEEDKPQRLQLAVEQDAAKVFDLEQDLMLRAGLVRLADDEVAVLLNMHHIASDGWSIGVLINEFVTLYQYYATENATKNASETAAENPLAPLAIQYVDFAAWHRDLLDGETDQLAWWQQQLADLPQVHNLPLDFQRPAEAKLDGNSVDYPLSESLTAKLRQLCQQYDVTPYMLLQTAFAAVLARFSREQDIVMGSPIAGRNHSEIESLIGFFVNTLVLRSDLSGEPGFAELLTRNKQMILEAFAHQEVPFDMVVEAVNPERSLSYSPLFQVLFDYQAEQNFELSLPGFDVETLGQEQTIAKFDLTLTVQDSADQFVLGWEYATSLFDLRTIETLSASLERLLTQVADDQQTPVNAINITPVDQGLAHIAAINDTLNWTLPRHHDGLDCLHQQFEHFALSQPDAPALSWLENDSVTATLSYRELNEKANQLARFILERGAKPGERVAICATRSFNTLTAVLAVLKAGCSYVPVDPAYPAERIEYMLSDSAAPLILSENSVRAAIPKTKVRVVCMDDDDIQAIVSQYRVSNLSLDLTADTLAYTIYTSGSTGQPKGVEISHRNWMTYRHAIFNRYGLSNQETVLQFCSISFDIFVEEMSASIFSGGNLVLSGAQATQESAQVMTCQQFWQAVSAANVSSVFIPTAYWHQLSGDKHLTADSANTPLQLIVIGGEAMSANHLVNWQQTLEQPIRLLNTYGPTEATIIVTVWDSSAYQSTFQTQEGLRPVPIGDEIPGTTLLILDENQQPVPDGAVGELYIAGHSVGVGYHAKPDMTKERFFDYQYPAVNDEIAGSIRVYRSGDMVRRAIDGNIEFYGRSDDQVKIRGFRIELGEIQERLSVCDGVGSCMVMAKDIAEQKQLVAWVIAKNRMSGDEWEQAFVQGLKDTLAEQLPDYMIPTGFVLLDDWPLNANGKVDRKKLPLPELSTVTQDYQPPATELEATLCRLFEQVLGLSQAGRDCNFFKAGGHSLLAVQLISLLRDEAEVELPLKVLFEKPSVQGLAQWIEEQQQQTTANSVDVLPPIKAGKRSRFAELSWAQQRLWFIDQLDGTSVQYNMPAAFELNGALNLAAIEYALATIIERHDVLKTTYGTIDGQASQIINDQAKPDFTALDLSSQPLEQAEQQVAQLIKDDAVKPFNLTEDAMLRMQLVTLSDTRHVMVFNMHHIASDGWSFGVLIREFVSLYEAFITEQPNPLAPLAVQYVDYARWQRNWLQGDALEQQTGYWKQQLQGIPELHSLPLDKPRPATQSFAGDVLNVELDETLTAQLSALCEAQGVTLYMLLQTAFATLIHRFSGEDDIVIGSPIAGRSHQQVEDLIGFFVNSLVIRTDLRDAPRFTDLLAQAKQDILNAYAHQYVPFEMLVEAINPVRSRSHTPLFQIMFVLQNQKEGALELPDLTLTPIEPEVTSTKFDLTLSIAEQANGLSATFEYCTALFEPETIIRLAHGYEWLLRSIVAAPDIRIDRLSLMSDTESQQLLTQWQDMILAKPEFKRIEHWISSHVARQPDAVALTFNDQRWTYQQLETLSGQLASCLADNGVKPGDRVGVAFNRSATVVIALLATMKAGAAYVPLDPEAPEARLTHIVKDSGAKTLLTESALVEKFAHHELPVVLVDDIDSVCADYQPMATLESTAEAEAAYIIYTSGTTGLPKGVVQTHTNAIRLLDIAVDTGYFGADGGFGVDDVWTLFHSTAFDFSVWEIWGALCFGGRLVIPDSGCVKDAESFVTLCRNEGVTVLNQTPGAFKAFMQAALDAETTTLFPALRYVIFGGEALATESLIPWWDAHDQAGAIAPAMINMYGITETTVHVTFKRVTRADAGSSTIGVPLGDQVIYLLDEQLKPVAPGAIGEMYVGGAGLSPGYLNREELTNERFIPNPWQSAAMEANGYDRLYRTGDLGRFTVDGELIYMGRNDDQVKVRGYRIEQGEIVNQMLQLDYVRDALVQVVDDPQGNKTLVAYVIEQGDGGDWRDDLSNRLPAYMVPAVWMTVTSWPLTVNGKIDRRALPAPVFGSGADYEAPQTDEEKLVCTLWAEVLELDVSDISRNDDFFALGGHSLLMIRYRAKLKSAGYDIAVAELYQASILTDMAELIRRYQDTEQNNAPDNRIQPDAQEITAADLPMVSLTPEEIAHIAATVPGGISNIQDIYPLSPLQEGMLFHAIQADGVDPYLVKTHFICDSASAFSQLQQAIEFVVTRHDSLRTQIIVEDLSNPVQVVSRNVSIPSRVIDITEAPETDNVTEWLSSQPLPDDMAFSLAQAPLLRLLAFRTSDDKHYVVLYHHHLLEDNFSLRVVNEELIASLTDVADTLPEAAKYREFIWRGMQTDMDGAKQFFVNTLKDIDEGVYPYGISETPEDVTTSDKVQLPLTPELSAAVKQLAKDYQVSETSVLHLAWGCVVARTSSRDDAVFGTVMSGRMQNVAGIDRMVGLCINTLPVRVRLNPVSFAETLNNVHHSLKNLITMEQVPLSLAQSGSAVQQGHPLFSSVLNCRLQQGGNSDEAGEQVLTETGIQSLGMEEHTNYPLTASVDYIDDIMQLTIEACEGIDAARVAGYFATALQQLVALAEQSDDAESPVFNLPTLLSDDETRLLLSELNDTTREYDHTATIHTLISAQAIERPDELAVICGDESLTFAALEQQACQIANLLVQNGVQSGDLVGLSFRRTVALMPAMLGILKVGAGYVPLSPDYPQERLSYMAQDSGISTVIAADDLTENFPDLRVFTLDAATDCATSFDADAHQVKVTANSLAYVVYTSGSTGQPKGVAVTHRNVVSLCLNSPFIDLEQATGFFGLSNVSFDGSVFDLFVSLINGKRVLIVPDSQLSDTSGWHDLCQDHGINTVFMTTALFNVLANEDNPVLDDFTQLLFGGEQANPAAINRWLDKHEATNKHLIHVYGPTETTVYATFGPLDSANYRAAPIGGPLANKTTYVLDSQQRLTPFGAVGELYIGGDGVAREYLNRSELTADRFIPDVFSNDSTARLYRTGDLVRWQTDSKGRTGLVFVGRVDNQVKIRGFRIELEEVEQQLALLPEVSESAVLVYRTGDDANRYDTLVGYVVADEQIDMNALKANLAEQMPAYMVPSTLIRLDQLPLTANGKVNKATLKELAAEHVSGGHGGEFIAPETDTEIAIAALWSELLQRDVADISKVISFFELGGNSLLVMRLCTAIKAQFGVEMSVKEIFDYQTIESQAELIDVLNGTGPVDDGDDDSNQDIVEISLDDDENEDEVSFVL